MHRFTGHSNKECGYSFFLTQGVANNLQMHIQQCFYVSSIWAWFFRPEYACILTCRVFGVIGGLQACDCHSRHEAGSSRGRAKPSRLSTNHLSDEVPQGKMLCLQDLRSTKDNS